MKKKTLAHFALADEDEDEDQEEQTQRKKRDPPLLSIGLYVKKGSITFKVSACSGAMDSTNKVKTKNPQ